MKKEFKQIKKLVTHILETNPKTRNSDNELYIAVIEAIGRGYSNKPIAEILLNLEGLGLPCFETVRRTRQKLQAEFPELQACDKVQDFRTEREIQFREYFGNECHD